MQTPFLIIGNWKSNKTLSEAKEWCEQITVLFNQKKLNLQSIKIVLCPSFIHIPQLKHLIEQHHLPINLGSQDISPFAAGAYTGAVHAGMVKGLVKFSLVGHSERRKHFNETDDILAQKVMQLKASGIESIYCVQEANMTIPEAVSIVGYEPVWAIGTGKPDTPENANTVARHIREKHGNHISIVYGGSVTSKNVAGYVDQEYLGGVLPGGASLDPNNFFELIAAASEAVRA